MSRFLLVTLVIFAVFAVGCNNDDLIFEIGGKYVDENMQIIFTDSISVNTYTIKWDSIPTSGYRRFLVGKYPDDVFGNISSRSYTKVHLPEGTSSIPNDAVFDSLQMILLYNGYSIGDTTKTFIIKVHRLEDKLIPGESGDFFNTSSLDFDPVPYGQITFTPRPVGGDTVKIRLSDTFGSELFDAFKDESDIVAEQSSFENYLKGFVINYDDSNESVIGFHAYGDTIPLLRMFYHYVDLEIIHKRIDFIIGTRYENDINLQFNQITSTDVSFELPSGQQDKVSALENDSTTFIQGGTGIFTRIEIPYLKNILEINSNIEVLHAELVLEPLSNSYTRNTIPLELSAYETNNANEFITPVSNIADLTIDDLFYEDTRYRFDITDFINAKLIEQTDKVPSLLITLSGVCDTIDRLIIGSRWHERNDVRLELYYMRYE